MKLSKRLLEFDPSAMIKILDENNNVVYFGKYAFYLIDKGCRLYDNRDVKQIVFNDSITYVYVDKKGE